jgi:hypothetical protein
MALLGARIGAKAAGGSMNLSATLDIASTGSFSAVYTLNTSDENLVAQRNGRVRERSRGRYARWR